MISPSSQGGRLVRHEAFEGTLPLAHLLACLDAAVSLMDECGMDVDARVIEAHRAQLAKGQEWPGTKIRPVAFPDGSTNA